MKGSFLSSQCEYELRVLYMGRWQFLTWEVHLLLGFCFHLLLFCFFREGWERMLCWKGGRVQSRELWFSNIKVSQNHRSEWSEWKSLSRVRLCDLTDYTVHGIFQARILEWVAFSFSRVSSQPRDHTPFLIQLVAVRGECGSGFLKKTWIPQSRLVQICPHPQPQAE